MKSKEIANIIYNMALDMGSMDGIEYAEEEIEEIEKGINEIRNDSFLQVLETIAMQNEKLYNWHKKIGG